MITPPLLAGIVMGTAMLASVCWVYVRHHAFGLGGSTLSVLGVLLLGMSVWRSIDVSVGGKGFTAKLQQVESQVTEIQQRTTATATAVNTLESRLDARAAQDALRSLGLFQGPADGYLGPQTVAAIRRFQSEKGLPQTGIPDATTLKALGIKSP